MIRLIYDNNGWTDYTEFFIYDGNLWGYNNNSELFIKIKDEKVDKALNTLNNYLGLEVYDEEEGHAYFDGDGEVEEVSESDLDYYYGVDIKDIGDNLLEYDKIEDWLEEFGEWE